MSHDDWNPTSERVFFFLFFKTLQFSLRQQQTVLRIWACYALWSATWSLIDTLPSLPRENPWITNLEIPFGLARKKTCKSRPGWGYTFRPVVKMLIQDGFQLGLLWLTAFTLSGCVSCSKSRLQMQPAAKHYNVCSGAREILSRRQSQSFVFAARKIPRSTAMTLTLHSVLLGKGIFLVQFSL